MSYYGIKNLSIVKTENGYNVKCEYYDSSIRSYEGYRVWHKSDRFYNTDFTNRKDLEYDLFKNFLNGNFHTSSGCGKFTCLSWNNRQVKVTEPEQQVINTLWNAYIDCKDNNLREELRQHYYNKEYEYYYRAWQEYLEDKKKYKNNKFIIQLDYMDYKDIYIKSMGSTRVKYSYFRGGAKKFTGNPKHIIEKLNGFKNQENIRVITIDK